MTTAGPKRLKLKPRDDQSGTKISYEESKVTKQRQKMQIVVK